MIIEKEEESELADHIRTISREGPKLDPDILEIMGNTIEMSHLKVKDVMIPRNQVQILNIENPYFQNLKLPNLVVTLAYHYALETLINA